MVAAISLITLNISMTSEWILKWLIVKETSRDLKTLVLNINNGIWKRKPRPKGNTSQKTLFTKT